MPKYRKDFRSQKASLADLDISPVDLLAPKASQNDLVGL
jgi:hypothetical protein